MEKRIMQVLEKQIEKIKIRDKEYRDLNKKTKEFCDNLGEKLKRKKIKAGIFIGGSLAKKTILKRDKYDIDIFVRFDKKYKDSELSGLLEKTLDKARKIHGSRDYFQVNKGKIIFEIIPVAKILKAEEAINVTDLSFFHVSYVKKEIEKNPRLSEEILLAKSFCYSQKCYGAESYIKGFSGYALELLVIYYKSFLKFLKAMEKSREQIIIDPEKYYKNKQAILTNLNEAKLSSPIVFVDPTYKERNTLAALSKETFIRFQEATRKFLKKPSSKFFEEKKINIKDYNLTLIAGTNKQEGDIAGSKLLKFFNFLAGNLEKYFLISKKEFVYNAGKKADLYFKIKPRKELILQGPPINAVENAVKFKSKHKNVFIKNSRVYAREKPANIKKFISEFKKKNKKIMKDMGIIGLKSV